MPDMLDIFTNDAFGVVSLTQAINVVPNAYGRLNELDVFPEEPVTTTSVAIQSVAGVLNLLPTRVRGAPPSLGAPEKRNVRALTIPHIPHDDFVLADEVQGVRSFLGGTALDSVADVVNRKLARMRAKHGITLEHLRAGAIKGQVLDYDGSVLLNLFTEFGITEKVVDFNLDNEDTDVAGVAIGVVGWIEDHLYGEMMTGVRALCSPEFFAALIAHPKVREPFIYYQSAQEPLRNDVRKGFFWQGITWEEYRGSATQLNEDKTTTTRKFIPANEVRFYPEGTQDTFRTYFAPADFIETVNTPGLPVYAKQAPDMEFQRWVKIHTQSNPLPVCKRPELLVRGTLT